MPPPDPHDAPRGPVAGIVLAAGAATRMGAAKALLPLAGRPMIVGIIEALVAVGGLSPIIVVTGHQPRAIEEALASWPVTFCHNADYAAGEMLSSVRTGLDALPDTAAAVLLAFADQPGVGSVTLGTLLARWQTIHALLLVPTHQGRRGHPILLSAGLFGEIRALSGTQTLRDLVHRHLSAEAQLAVEDPAILWDIDTPEDYRRAAARWRRLDKP